MGAVVLPVIAFVLPNTAGPTANSPATRKEKIRQLDLIGNLVFIPCITCLFIALSWAGTKYDWNSATVIGLFVTFAVLLAAFIYDQHVKKEAATLPLRVMKNRSVVGAMLSVLCCIGAQGVIQYYVRLSFSDM